MSKKDVNRDKLYIVKLCRVTSAKGFINGKELYDMCKQYGFMVNTSKLNDLSIIEHDEIIVKKPLFSESKQVKEFLTGVKLDYTKVVKSDVDIDYQYAVKTYKNEYDLFVLSELAEHHPTQEFLDKYVDGHNIEAYRIYLENLKIKCKRIHEDVQSKEKVKQMIKNHTDNLKKK